MSTPAPTALDVRPLPADRKGQAVLAIFEDLDAGDSFLLVDDTEPTPLCSRIEAEWPGEMRWVSLEEGPPVWYVQVMRLHVSM